jgi:CO/xanthine dehydrogenase FAD-binding subunit
MELIVPNSLDQALRQMAAHPEARAVAGGTDLFVCWPKRVDDLDGPLVDLTQIPELRYLQMNSDELSIGATATYWDLLSNLEICEQFPILALAARQIGAIQVQTRGTWAGNVVNASPAADGVMALMACDALVEVRSTTGCWEYPLSDFYTGYRRTKLRPEQLVTALKAPRIERSHIFFNKVGGRRGQTISKVGLAVCQSRDAWRVAVNGMAPTVRRCPAIEQALDHNFKPRRVTDWIDLIRNDLEPIDDHRSTRNYREQVLARLLSAVISSPAPTPRFTS